MVFCTLAIAINIALGIIAPALKLPILLVILAPLIGTPIGVWVYQGLSGTGLDILFLWLQKTGQNIFVSSFITKLTTNLIKYYIHTLVY